MSKMRCERCGKQEKDDVKIDELVKTLQESGWFIGSCAICPECR